MNPAPTPRTPSFGSSRAERWIAGTRLIMAGASLLAVWWDPSEPSVGANAAYVLLAAYAVAAVGIAAWVWIRPVVGVAETLAMHVVDLGVFAALMYLVQGPTSPFFVFFTFAEVAAAIRWQWRGTLWTAAAALLLYGALAAYVVASQPDPLFELDRFIVRVAYLVVLALLVGYLSAYEARARQKIRLLGEWPRVSPASESFLPESLSHASTLLHCPRILLWWEEPDEPFAHSSVWTAGAFRLDRVEVTEVSSPVAADSDATAFFTPDGGKGPAGGGAAVPVCAVSPDGAVRRISDPLDPGFREGHRVGRFLAVPMLGTRVDGWLFSLDGVRITLDDVATAHAVAQEMAHRIDRIYTMEEERSVTATAERLRLAGDLHDGILQTLTGLSLQVQAARQMLLASGEVGADAARAREVAERLAQLRRLIESEQREIRVQIKEFQHEGALLSSSVPPLGHQLRAMAENVEGLWGIRVAVDYREEEGGAGPDLEREAYRLAQEAVFNAARHAGADTVEVAVRSSPDGIEIQAEDDGRGFSFRGRFDHSELMERNLGPISIKHRIRRLGGTLTIESDARGARLEMHLPHRPNSPPPSNPDPPRKTVS